MRSPIAAFLWLLVLRTAVAAPADPFGGDDAGCFPAAGTAVRCQATLANALAKAIACLTTCHVNRAAGRLADEAAETACEVGDPKRSCRAKFEKTAGAGSALDRTCPALLDAAYRLAAFDATRADVDAANVRAYPCATAPTTTTTTLPSVCGDGIRQAGEECDDGNTLAGDGCDAGCHVEPPPGQTSDQATALHLVNVLRAAAGLRGLTLDGTLDVACTNHASYYHANQGQASCVANPHVEVGGCIGFTGAQFFDRDAAAGFLGSPSAEDMAFVGDPTLAVPLQLNTVFHRIPLLSATTGTMGYGEAVGVDVFDFGASAGDGTPAVVLWPPPGATGVPASFAGNEGPPPPPPPSGYPSGPVVSILPGAGHTLVVTSHDLRDAADTPLLHTFVGPGDPTIGALMAGSYAMYAHGPAGSGATFRAIVSGTLDGNAFTRDWTFTVQ